MAEDADQSRFEYTVGTPGKQARWLPSTPHIQSETSDEVHEVLAKQLPPSVRNNAVAQLALYSEKEGELFVKRLARENGMEPAAVLQQLIHYKKDLIRSKEKGNIRHYHRTSIPTLEKIIESNTLLSRSLLKERHPDVVLSNWSASNNVMMTRDSFDKEGNLKSAGVTSHGVGAANSEVVIVFKESIMTNPTYNPLALYPTISEANFAEYCEALWVQTDADAVAIQKLLAKFSLSIPVEIRK